MNEAHVLPAPIVPYGWDDVDTSVDDEVPELFSEEQLDRYVDTVASLLRAVGMEVEGPDVDDPAHLEARRPGGRLTLEVDVQEDRSVEWSVSGDGELDAGTKALALAGFLVRVLDTEPRGAHG